jgi:hypothetical protein
MTRVTPIALAASVASLACLCVAGASAAPPTPHQISIAASSPRVVFGSKVTLTGQLTGADNAGETVTLQEDPFPFGDFKNSVSTLTAADGTYKFERTPSLNIKYRADAKSKEAATSPEVVVLVAPKVKLAVSDKTPKAGQKVTFSGTLAPAHDGLKLSIQRLSSTGHWKTIARATLVDAGTALSNYSRKLTINSTGRFRTVLPAHDDHATGKSSSTTLKVHS